MKVEYTSMRIREYNEKKRMSYPCDHKSEEETDKERFNRNMKAIQEVTVGIF
jgi:hypothetical protein